MQGDRRNRANEKPNRRFFMMWLVLSAIFCAIGLPRIVQGQFPDPDDVLRLVQIRDLLNGQSWFDLHQYRIDPPGGTLMHWSRLVDLPIALVILLLTPLIGVSAAETSALVAVPLLTLGAILFCIGKLAWRLFDTTVAGFACLSLGLLAPFVFQLQPMRIDHHGWQIFSIAFALWSISGRSPIKGGALAGLAMALGLTISVEILPMVAAFGAVLALRWFGDHHQRWWLVSYMQALALGLVAAFFATRGIADLAQHCDAVSPAHLGFFVITAIGTSIIAASPPLPRFLLIGVFALTGAAGLSFFALSSPACVTTPFAQLDPAVHANWYERVLEGQPLWKQDLAQALPILVQLLIALLVAVTLRANNRDWLRVFWTEYALLLFASIVLSLFVWRSAAFAALLSAIPIGWLSVRLLLRLRVEARLPAKLLSALAIIIVLLPATPVRLWHAVAAEDKDEPILVRNSSCEIGKQAALLDSLPAATIFAPLDIGPAILLESHHSVVATGHHRAETAMRDVIVTFTGSSDEARKLVAGHGATYVALCTDLAEINLYAQGNPASFASQLVNGNNPEWLEVIELGGPAEFKVWRVKP